MDKSTEEITTKPESSQKREEDSSSTSPTSSPESSETEEEPSTSEEDEIEWTDGRGNKRSFEAARAARGKSFDVRRRLSNTSFEKQRETQRGISFDAARTRQASFEGYRGMRKSLEQSNRLYQLPQFSEGKKINKKKTI